MKQRQASRPTRALLLLLSTLMAVPVPVFAQIVKPLSKMRGDQEQLLEMRWSDAPLSVVLDHYAEITGRTLIMSPGVPQVLISLKSNEKLSETEFLVAIESVLAMNSVALVPLGDKFLKVVPSAELRTHGEEISLGLPGEEEPDTDKVESRIIELKYLELAEVQPLIDGLKHTYGKVQTMERANAFMITDTVANIRRIAEVIEFLDKPAVTKVETRIYELQHAEAGEVAGRLNELIQQSQEEGQQRRTPNIASSSAASGTRGVIRAGTTAAQQAAAAAAARSGAAQPQSAMDLAERGIIQGDVKIVSDERTNILIIISEPPNFAFFDKIVTILDKAVDPDISVEVVALEFAEAEEISGILNDFVGAATAESQSARGASRNAAAQAGGNTDARATALRDFIASRQTASAARAPAGATDLAQGVGRLSEDTRILADERTNSILLMGRRSDIEILKSVVDQLDVMLAQVMIEAVIIEVTLNDDLQYGLDWLQRSYEVFNEERIGPNNSFALREPVFAFGGGQDFRDAEPFIDGSQVSRATALSPGALTYYATFFDLNLDAVLRLARSSSDAKILQTPVVVTTDNTEARIIVGESRPTVTSTGGTVSGVNRNTYQYQDIGIELTVTPRINPQKFVVMEINQTADNVGGFEVIDGNNVPVITRRELEAQIAVENRSSIILGGLIGSEARMAQTKVPILGDIPILGNLFRSHDKSDNRTELLVIITPYVMATPEEVQAETWRLNDRSASGKEWSKSWSDSPLVARQAALEDAAPAPLLDRLVDKVREEKAVRPEGMLARLPDEEIPTIEGRVERTPIEEALRNVVDEPMDDPSLYEPVSVMEMPVIEEPVEVLPDPMPEPAETVVPEEAIAPPLSRIEVTPPADVPSPRAEMDLVARARAAMESPREALDAAVAPEPMPVPVPVRRPALPLPVVAQPAPPVAEPIPVAVEVPDVAVEEPPEVVEEVAPEVAVEEPPAEIVEIEVTNLSEPVLRSMPDDETEQVAEVGVEEAPPAPVKKRRGLLARLFGGKPKAEKASVEGTEEPLVEETSAVAEELIPEVAPEPAAVEPTMVVASNIPRRSLFSSRRNVPVKETSTDDWKPVPVVGRTVPSPSVIAPEPEPVPEPVVVVKPAPEPVVVVKPMPEPVVVAVPAPAPVIMAPPVEPEPEPEPVVVVVEEPPAQPRVVVPVRPSPPVRAVTPVERVELRRVQRPVVTVPVEPEPPVRTAIPTLPGRATEPSPATAEVASPRGSSAVQRARMLAELKAVVNDAAPPASEVVAPARENGEDATAPLTPGTQPAPRRFSLPGRTPTVVVPAPEPARAAPPVAAPPQNLDDTEAPPPLK